MTNYETSINFLGFAQLEDDIWYQQTIHCDFVAVKIDELNDLTRVWRSDKDGNALTLESRGVCANTYKKLLGMEKEFIKNQIFYSQYFN